MSMRLVTLADIAGLARYEEIRDSFRRRIIDLKRARRVPVGGHVTFVFENFDTVLFQVQEMLRAERITDLDRVREEIDVYNELIPGDGELSATMLIEITEQDRVRPELQRLIGIDECVWLEVGDGRVRAVFEPGRSSEEKLSAVQYVRFPLDAAARRGFAASEVPVRLVIEHENYREQTPIAGDVRRSLAADLGAA
jgi:hypothetical protein